MLQATRERPRGFLTARHLRLRWDVKCAVLIAATMKLLTFRVVGGRSLRNLQSRILDLLVFSRRLTFGKHQSTSTMATKSFSRSLQTLRASISTSKDPLIVSLPVLEVCFVLQWLISRSNVLLLDFPGQWLRKQVYPHLKSHGMSILRFSNLLLSSLLLDRVRIFHSSARSS